MMGFDTTPLRRAVAESSDVHLIGLAVTIDKAMRTADVHEKQRCIMDIHEYLNIDTVLEDNGGY